MEEVCEVGLSAQTGAVGAHIRPLTALVTQCWQQICRPMMQQGSRSNPRQNST